MMDGPPRMVAWQPGQVGNEAATAVYHECRRQGSPLIFLLCFFPLAEFKFGTAARQVKCASHYIAIAHVLSGSSP